MLDISHLIEIPPSHWVIVTCTTGFSWREAMGPSLIVESPSILAKKNFCQAIGGLGPLVYASGDIGACAVKGISRTAEVGLVGDWGKSRFP